ncbi:MAG: tRNA preQ1(34) S-adenosylmethionine ribosyltransferase-isomerase QueA [Candidatus Latescibacteria bacterium]|nr:tRNA preQ1(34) S-adenosylmethionine ribosyltransferase-isomerase QueA [bacterium]MBD3423945.1 tRNA preQ1(34) S-adenosylmethionine ribosyltransferase-isomerase QueA [Candidatus Latescibacterota bacterium]
MKLEDFDYYLPGELIAQYPSQRREESRLIVFRRNREIISETIFSNLVNYIQPGDLLVINNTRVIPARLLGRKSTGGEVEVFLVRRTGERTWTALVKPSRRVREGIVIEVGEGEGSVRITGEIGRGKWEVKLEGELPEYEFLDRYGHVPLPPYIKRQDEDIDTQRYQTVYASEKGSVAAPTAGLHFSGELLRSIRAKGCVVLPLTLHIGPGTFRPLENDSVEDNRLSDEEFMIEADYWEIIRVARRERRRVIAVGTTTTRVLESLAHGKVEERRKEVIGDTEYIRGLTRLFIYPGFDFRVVDALVTNLHLPRSSLFLLVSAFAGRENMLRVYQWAVKRKIRFYSYGDAMFII